MVKLLSGLIGALAGAAALSPMAAGQTFPANYTPTTLASSLSLPTSMALAPDGSMYICQQGGSLRRWSSAGGLTTVTTFTVDSSVERGLLGVALDPAFATNRFVYVYYTMPTPSVHNTLNRITLNAAGTALVAGSEATILTLNNLSAGNHNGGAIHFGPDGKLYVGVGENAVSANSQLITNLLGKMLRVNPDPANPIPSDNPTSFPGITGSPTGNNRAIWAVGLRNPFTFTFQPGTGRMFINDVGNNTWEEINDGLVGRNYGWSLTEGTFTQSSFPNFTEPLVWYQHTGGTNNGPGGAGGIGSFTGFAIVGGVFYTPYATANPNFPIAYSNDYFFGDEVSGFIRTFDPAANNGGAFATSVSGVVDLLLAPDNTMLVLRGAGTGTGSLLRVTYTGTSGACCDPSTGVCALSNGLNCAAGSSFIWGTVLCSPNPCTQPTGACCAANGTCSTTTSGACTGVYQGNNTLCSPNPCPQPTGACCAADGMCTTTTSAACTGAYQGNGTLCSPNPCPQPTGACCAADGTCTTATLSLCFGTYQGNGTLCSPNLCPQPTGACCGVDGTCATTTSAACAGAYQGNNTPCTPNPCPQPTGACCDGSACTITTLAVCGAPTQHFSGLGSACNSSGNNTTPCCKCDFDHNGVSNVADIFQFLAAWFAGDPRADFNGDAAENVSDIFGFLAAWFVGC